MAITDRGTTDAHVMSRHAEEWAASGADKAATEHAAFTNPCRTMLPFTTRQLLVLRLIAAGLLAAGIAFPQIRTTLGYTYHLTGTVATLGYAVAAALVALAVFEEHLSRALALKLHVMGLAVLAGMALYAGHVTLEGLRWFDYQIAADMSAWSTVDANVYWAKLYELAGLVPGQSVFNDLRLAHARFGPSVTINGATVFYDTVNALSPDQVRQLLTLPGGGYTAVPLGFVLIVAALLLYGSLHFGPKRPQGLGSAKASEASALPA